MTVAVTKYYTLNLCCERDRGIKSCSLTDGLIKRFSAATCNHAISTSELQKNIPYHIKNAVRNITNFGHSILVTLKDDSNNTFECLYGTDILTDEDVNEISEEKIKLQIVYQGNCKRTREYVFSLTSV